jgi:predicted transglutaminase-like cysteine proteinase
MRVLLASTLAVTAILLSVIGNGALANSSGDAAFMATKGRTAQPIGYHDFCKDHAAECAVHSSGRQRVTLTAERWNTLVAVNNQVNTSIKPETDEQIFGRPEVWFYPTDRGDCEDYVLLKRRMLSERGWPVGALLITVVRQQNGDGHAVLTVLTDRGDLVLDNLDPHITPWNDTPYVYLKRQSTYDTGEWVAIDDGRTSTVSSLHN